MEFRVVCIESKGVYIVHIIEVGKFKAVLIWIKYKQD